jgi:DNA mismatch repair protein MutS
MPPKQKNIYDIYFQITEESIQKYGPNTIVFYQVGAFFEMYGAEKEKVVLKSKMPEFTQLVQLKMSKKDVEMSDGSVIVMAGFRDYSLDRYLALAVENEYTAVVYVQNMSNPKAITRELHGVFSPGTYISCDTVSSPKLSNHTVCIWLATHRSLHSNIPQLICGISSTHVFTGESCIFEYDTPFLMNPTTFDELERYISVISPSEAIIISYLSESNTNQVIQYLGLTVNTHIVNVMDPLIVKCQKETYISHILTTFFGDESHTICAEFQMYPTGTYALCYLLHFLQERNPNLVKKIKIPQYLNSSHRVVLANHTLKQLNIIDDETTDSSKAGKLSSVASFLNKCCTAMGKRVFKNQITSPTMNTAWIESEYNKTSQFLDTPPDTFADIRNQLKTICDLEKVCRQLMVSQIFPDTIHQMYESICVGRYLVGLMDYPIPCDKIVEDISSVMTFLETNLYLDKCQYKTVRSNSFQEPLFRQGVYPETDALWNDYTHSQSVFEKIHEVFNNMMKSQSSDETEYVKIHETDKSGNTLQITKKRSEILKKCLKNVPVLEITPDFVIQTKDIKFVKSSGSNEEINFPQLTTLLNHILSLKQQVAVEVEKGYYTFIKLFETKPNLYSEIDRIIQWIISLDVLQSKTYVAKKYNYCRPVIDHTSNNKSFFEAKGMRHVLIEHLQKNELYVANDIVLSSLTSDYDGLLIFGTNAVGKTSLIRAVGICIIMAQSGLYVPCSSFLYSPYSAIFSRILGNDNLFKGLSTFAVEMSELRVILKSADQQSLVLGDELCSGTEMESALSLFSAGLVELSRLGTTFLFATHFHEITRYEEIRELKRMGLKHMTVQYDPSTGTLIYDRILNDGQGNRMYGLEVCRSLFMEPSFLEKAYAFRTKYFPDQQGSLGYSSSSYNGNKIRGMCDICKKELASETHHLTPQRLADENGFINTFHKNHSGNLASVCEACHSNIHHNEIQLVKQKTTNGYAFIQKK